MFVVSEEWKAAYPGATAGILVVRGLRNPARHPALETRRLQVEEALRGRFGGMDRAQLVATAPLDAYSVCFHAHHRGGAASEGRRYVHVRHRRHHLGGGLRP